jgi:hypothetical protein
LLSIIRVAVAVTAATVIGRLVPGAGKMMGLFAIGIAGMTYALALFILREFGPTDREKFARILKLRRNT